jgi:AcrR family transcriptional regulator
MSAHAAPVRSSPREGAHVVEMQRRRLLLAMRELAGEEGLAKTSVGMVCARSRVSRRTFYELFADCEACFLAAFEHAASEVAETVVVAWEQHGRWQERIWAGLEALLVLFDEQPRLARLCVIEAPKGGPTVLAMRRQWLDTLAAAVDEGRNEARGEGGPPTITAESTVGGALAVIHARLLEASPSPLLGLLPSLTSMIVLPYLGKSASRREAQRPVRPQSTEGKHSITHAGEQPARADTDPFGDLRIRFTYRTARVLKAIAFDPGMSNRQVGEAAGASDQGQISKLLKRLARAGLVENGGAGPGSGDPNTWRLTSRGEAVQKALEPSRLESVKVGRNRAPAD